MPDKKDEVPQEANDIPSHIKQMMGPTPDEAPKQSEPVVTAEQPKPEPTSAPPIIPDDALPKEVKDETKPTDAENMSDSPEEVKADVSDTDTTPVEGSDEDEAVTDIMRAESDEVLAKQDEDIEKAFVPKEQPKGFFGRIKQALSSWWHNPKARNLTLLGLALIVAALIAVPTTRYAILNTVGVRASVTMTVIDEGTRQPLKNVTVGIAGATTTTDSEGNAKLENVKLGDASVSIQKVAFAPITQQITVGWGSNQQGEVALQPTGAQYRFVLKDYLSDTQLTKVEATSGLASAVTDEKGVIVITVDVDDQEKLEVTFAQDGYRQEKRSFSVDQKETQTVKMVPDRKHVFVSKRSGKYDLYKIDVDGKNEKVLLAATGTEREDMVIVPHPTAQKVALVSTRDDKHNDDGFLLSGLTIVDVETGETTDVGISERMQIVDWVGDRLVYVQIQDGASASSPKRHRLMSYDLDSGQTQELAASNYFNDVTIAKGVVYYAPSSSYQKGRTYFHSVNPDGTNPQTPLNREVWNIFRSDYETLQLSVQQDWYQYTLGDGAATGLNGAPANQTNKLFRDNEKGTQSIWVDQRDGKGVLILHDTDGGDEKTLRTQSGLRNPVYWLTDQYIVFRINTDQETADYVMNVTGGEPKKIKDVTNTGGIDRWYYYQ